ncbi:MAG: AbrB/MazE/SpoVT family DNA-binding domain-containing protein [Actinomycetota bacterium]
MVDAQARITSKGQVTIPKPVRDALGLREGDAIVFSVDDGRATIAKADDLIALAASVPVPEAVKGLAWSQVLRRAHRHLGEAPR